MIGKEEIKKAKPPKVVLVVIWVTVAAIVVVSVKNWWMIRKDVKMAASYPVVQEFHLKVGEEIPTILLKPGDHCRLWANKPYEAVSNPTSEGRKIYQMSAGWEGWLNDTVFEGRLRLIGKSEETVVKIIPR